MKKVLSIVLLFVFLSAYAFPCNAEIGFSGMTDDELLEAQEELKTELLTRGLIKTITLPAGLYEVGTDIPHGKYIITAATPNIGIMPIVRVFADKETANSQGYQLVAHDAIIDEILPDLGSCMVDLQDGYVLCLRSVSFSIQKYSLPAF